jgi:hypothetical protein
MPSVMARLRRCLGRRWALLAFGRPDDEVSIVKLPRPCQAIRSDAGDTVSVTIGHTGEALLAELRSVVGPQRTPERAMFRT